MKKISMLLPLFGMMFIIQACSNEDEQKSISATPQNKTNALVAPSRTPRQSEITTGERTNADKVSDGW